MVKETALKIIGWIRRKLFIISLATITYFWGLYATIGLIIGYFTTKFFSGSAEAKKGRIPSLRLSIKGYKLHLHHWLLAASCLVALEFSGILNPNNFLFWLGGGMALQGLLCYNDWYKIVYKK